MVRVFAVLLAASVAGVCGAQDVDGGEDHPLLTRFDAYRIAVGPVTGYRTIDDWVEVDGRITRLNYKLVGERSYYEVYANYLSAVKKAGFEILAEGHSNDRKGTDVGGRQFLTVHYEANPVPPGESMLLTGSATSGGAGFFAAKLERPQGNVYAVISVGQYKEDEIHTMVDIIEVQAMEDDLVFVDAEAMSKAILQDGKVALYGIFFDHDKATSTAESKPALDEIAKLLENESELDVYVVGHTDLTGSLDYNLKLSKERAQSIVNALVNDYGIAQARLDAHGVGPLVPVMSNQQDQGRAKNRRVELVER